MKNVVLRIAMAAMATVLLNGCGKSSNEYSKAMEALGKQPPDTDVTTSPEYNFSSFSGTVWKTKVNVAVTDAKRYNGWHEVTLFPAEMFDKNKPSYVPVHDIRVIAVLPIGTLMRIDRLLKDNGEWGGVEVTATVKNGEFAEKVVYLDQRLLGKNVFVWAGWSQARTWVGDTNVLEAVTNSP